jgi:hypothetical protein
MSYTQPHNALGPLSLQGQEFYGEDDLVASLRLQIRQTHTVESFSAAIDILQDALLVVLHVADERSVDRLTEGWYVYRLGLYFFRRSRRTSSAEDLDTGISQNFSRNSLNVEKLQQMLLCRVRSSMMRAFWLE